MKRSSLCFLAAVVACAGLSMGQPQVAEHESASHDANARGRYQLGTYMHQNALTQGYYILDTQTGALWSGVRSEKPRRISGPLN